MVNRSYVDQYIEANANLTLLKIKRPLIKDWQATELSEEKVRAHKGNLGWVLSERDLVIDVDPRNGGSVSFEKLTDQFGGFDNTVKTAGGGFHIYLSISQKYIGRKLKKNLKGYEGIDFLSIGTQCVIAGSKVESKQYKWTNSGFHQSKAPADLLDLLVREQYEKSDVGDDLGDFEGLIGDGSASEERVLGLLDKIDHNIPNDDWVRVGMALKNWDPNRGLELWEEWSVGGGTWREGETANRWPSFRVDGNVTIGTLVHMAKTSDFEESLNRRQQMVNKIQGSDEREINVSLYNEICQMELSDQDREVLAVTIQRRLYQITGVKPTIGTIRPQLRYSIVNREAGGEPAWTRNWVYVDASGEYGSVKKRRCIREKTFRHKFQQRAPMIEGGSRLNVIGWLEDNGWIQTVTGLQYLPQAGDEPLPYVNGQRYLNTFSPETIPESKPITKKGLAVINRVIDHVQMIIGDEDDVEILLQWMAHNIQFPGKKILWSPVIQSCQGAGKSLFKEVLIQGLGGANIGIVPTQALTRDFNGWATGTVVNILEELKLAGHNRFDTANALKPMITDEVIDVNEKNVKAHNVQNVTNYISFTNYKDAIPLDDGDRRYWIAFSPLSMSDLPDGDYFQALFEDVRTYGGQVREWMMEYPVDKIESAVRAPETRSKAIMIRMEEDKLEGLTEVRQLLKTEGIGWDENVVFTARIFNHLKDETLFSDPIDPSRRDKATILRRCGLSPFEKQIKFKGDKATVYTKRDMGLKEIRRYIKTKEW